VSDGNGFTNGEIAMSFLTAWIIGFGTSSVVAIVAAGKATSLGIGVAALAGLVTAAKDYRSLKRLPAVSNGNANFLTKPETQTQTETKTS
jgi:hypothetical protein